MRLLNEQFQIYQSNMSDLTFGDIRRIRGFSDNESISEIAAFYDGKNDRFIVNESGGEELYEFCRLVFTKPLCSLEEKLETFRGRKEIIGTIIYAKRARLENEKKQEKEIPNYNPNPKFISIGGDMFQISKIVSVKKRDDGDGKYIEVFMTNRAASIKKKYQCGCDRDNAFVEVKKILNSIS